MMIGARKDDLKEFQKAMTSCKDEDLKNLAIAPLPVLQKHLDSINAIAGKRYT
jgi:uncharacterized protein DUF4142